MSRWLAAWMVVVGCSSPKQVPQARDDAPKVQTLDAATAPAVPDAMVDAALPVDAGVATVEQPPKRVKAPRKKPCPACGIGCPHGVPSSKVDENGCSVCACEDLMAPVAPSH